MGPTPGLDGELKLSYMFQESITHKYQNRPISSPPKSVIKTMEISDSRHFLSMPSGSFHCTECVPHAEQQKVDQSVDFD